MIRHPPSSPLFPYTPLFRSGRDGGDAAARDADVARGVEARLGVEHASARQHEIVRLGAGCVPRREARRRAEQGRRSEEHTSELQSLAYLVCRLLLEKKKNNA